MSELGTIHQHILTLYIVDKFWRRIRNSNSQTNILFFSFLLPFVVIAWKLTIKDKYISKGYQKVPRIAPSAINQKLFKVCLQIKKGK